MFVSKCKCEFFGCCETMAVKAYSIIVESFLTNRILVFLVIIMYDKSICWLHNNDNKTMFQDISAGMWCFQAYAYDLTMIKLDIA